MQPTTTARRIVLRRSHNVAPLTTLLMNRRACPSARHQRYTNSCPIFKNFTLPAIRCARIYTASRNGIITLLFERLPAFGLVTALANKAGIFSVQLRFDPVGAVQLQQVLSANGIGVFLCFTEVEKRMPSQHGGYGSTIEYVSSFAAARG